MYKITFHLDKQEREKAAAIVDAEHSPLKESTTGSLDDSDQDSPLSLDDDSDSILNGGQHHDGIEMRRSHPRSPHRSDSGEGFSILVV